jgi:hypothetical protein
MPENNAAQTEPDRLFFIKGAADALRPRDGEEFDWEKAAGIVRAQLADAMNARHIAFLLGSGCSSLVRNGQQFGIPTMHPLAQEFSGTIGQRSDRHFLNTTERKVLRDSLGFDVAQPPYSQNLERLMEVLHSQDAALKVSSLERHKRPRTRVRAAIEKIQRFVLMKCTEGSFAHNDDSVRSLYEAFYRKLIYRDRSLPRPWIFTTNYDQFNEAAMDRIGLPYCNGFMGVVERRFNPATFRYALAEQLDVTSKRWSAVDGYIYLCKLHGSVTWYDDGKGLFPIRETAQPDKTKAGKLIIYPTPSKQDASLGSPYVDLFREFQTRIVREQSVLFVVGYSFGDEHLNNIIYQALTIPTFRLIVFTFPEQEGEIQKLRQLDDPRIWLIGGAGPTPGSKAHYFDTVVDKFMPEPPGNKIDTAVRRVLTELIAEPSDDNDGVADDPR